MKKATYLALVILVLSADSAAPVAEYNPHAKQTLHYGVEWRLIRAGNARVTRTPTPAGYEIDLHLESAGMVSKLYRVNDDYKAVLSDGLCAQSVFMKSEEGKRRRETKIDFADGKSRYGERDLVKNNVVLTKELAVPPCVHEYLGGMMKLRGMRLDPGQSAQVPLTDGKKFANVKVEAQERESVRIGTQTYNTIRYEIFLFNDVIINRKAKMQLWITDDVRRLPVQLRVRLNVLVGTINLQLEKVE